MTKLKTNDPLCDNAEKVEPVVPAEALDSADAARADHYDISVQCDEGGDPDRVHVTSIAPRVRK